MEEIQYRVIRKEDDPLIAGVIRSVLEEFGVNRPGTVYTDPGTDHISDLLQTPGSAYWVVEYQGKIIGGSGIFPTEGLPDGYVELVKLYVLNEFRGKRIGKKLIEMCIDKARELGYKKMYLETMPELDQAVGLYESLGFNTIHERLGESGHFSCHIWMVKDL